MTTNHTFANNHHTNNSNNQGHCFKTHAGNKGGRRQDTRSKGKGNGNDGKLHLALEIILAIIEVVLDNRPPKR